MADLPDLLDEIASGLVALPDFQRDFDWDETDVMKLLVTVLKGWPAGSLLLMHGRAKFFEVRAFDDGPQPKKDRLRFTVLDGQQRLTALFQAIYDRGPYVYTVKTAALEAGTVDALEEGVEAFKRAHWDRRYRGLPWSQSSERVPLYVLKSPSDYFDWRDSIVAEAPSEARDALAGRLSTLYRDALESVHRYKFPAVSVEADLEPAAISRIFERVNKTGLPLSTFDLMVARVYEPGWNLRVHWENARTGSTLIDPFLRDDGMPILQTIALREKSNVRDSAVLEIAQSRIRDGWTAAVDAVEEALTFLMQHCGVVRPDWLPYRGMILPLAGLAVDYDLEDHTDLLSKWFWSRSFALTFDVAANTRVVAEYQRLHEIISGDQKLEVPNASESLLLEASRRRQGAIWRAFFCVLAYRDARDLTGERLGLKRASEELEPLGTHVVPAPVLARDISVPRHAEAAHLRVLNLILANRGTARRIAGDYLSTVAEEAVSNAEEEAVEEALASQFLPPLAQLDGAEDDWEGFLRGRLRQLSRFLREEAGQVVERPVEG
jgi:hypothetical protein